MDLVSTQFSYYWYSNDLFLYYQLTESIENIL